MVNKIWLAQYQAGVPFEINPDAYQSLAHLLTETCEKYADRIAYVNFGSHITYRELEQQSRLFAQYLFDLGCQKGDRIAIMMPNCLQYPITMLGALRAGLIVVNVNPLYTPDELIHQVNDAGAKIIVIMANFASTLEKALPETSIKHVIVTELGDLFAPVKKFIFNFVIKHIKKMVPAYHLPNAISLKRCFSTTPHAMPVLHHDDIAFLQYTGGTTGIAKGAILTHGNIIANILQAYEWIKPLGVGSHDMIVTALPLYHIFSLLANCFTFLLLGAQNVLITNPRDIPHFIKEIKSIQFTAITGVNTLFNALLNHPDFKNIDFSKLKLALSGGMALQKNVAMRWHAITKSPILEAYGLTETSPAVTINPMYMTEYNGSIGLPLPSTDIAIINDEGEEVDIGEPGELLVSGPQVMRSYWRQEGETVNVFTTKGFLRTGDIAYINEKGFIYLVDRKKDMILVSGFNVYPNEVEQVISMHPGVLEVAVIGIGHPRTGEAVKACIVKRDPDLTPDDLIQHCKQHLTTYKIPKYFEFYDALPKTQVGKISRKTLREEAKGL